MPTHEVIDPRFRSFVLANAELELLFDQARWLEGPVWFADHQSLLVSDVPNDRILCWRAGAGVSVQRSRSGFSNGHTRDRQGRLIGCSHLYRDVRRVEIDGAETVLVNRFGGKRLNSPNDVVVKRDGTVWFTDPHYGIETDYEGTKRMPELAPSVYRFDPRDESLVLVADDFDGPNGLCFSPDEKLLYVAESGTQFAAEPRRHIRVFDVVDDGSQLANSRVFHTVSPGYADGFRCDEEGNLWTGAADGVHCIHPSGALLGKIFVPHAVANLCFGGRHRSHLFLCAGQRLYTIAVNRRGSQWP
ncbi:MAG: SMP-30/gluconolactonase/LRE family protein [Pseudomonadota bacterium]